MKTTDLLRMCRENLFRRKARTFLSVLGVVIGCCSILLMLSIGVGLNASNEAWLSEMGDLNKIDVYAYNASGNAELKLDEDAVRSFRSLEHVAVVIPKYGTGDSLNIRIVCGNNERYRMDYVTIVGIDPDILDEAGYTLDSGNAPDRADSAVIGQYFEYALLDSRKPDGRNQIPYYEYLYGDNTGEMPDPYKKLVGQKITMQVLDEKGKPVYSKELQISGKLCENYSAGYETSEGRVLRADDLQRIVKEAHKELGIKQKGSLITSVSVMADDIENVTAVEDAIHEIGYQTNSMASMRESTEKEMASIQLVLGGIGAVSLLVAAIGIINTMIMSVSERTKEIGVMKAIGCYVRDIRKLFLMESAAIGLLGGLFGAVLSFIISCIINLVAAGMNEYTDESQTIFEILFTSPTRTSIIPLWLFLFGLTFSVTIGLVAGFYPANKAVKISALEAMKNE